MKDLAKLFKDLKKLQKTDDDLHSVLTELFARASDSCFEDTSEEIELSRQIFNEDWTYMRHKKTLKPVKNYYDRTIDIRTQDGDKGVKKFQEQHEEFYDAALYKKSIERALGIAKKLEDLGFKAKVIYTKKYQKCTVDNQPESLWMKVSW